MIFLRINLPSSCSLNSIKANRDHAFFCSKQDFSLLWPLPPLSSRPLVAAGGYGEMFQISEFAGGHNEGIWGTLSPAGSRGKAPVGGLGDEVARKLKIFGNIPLKMHIL